MNPQTTHPDPAALAESLRAAHAQLTPLRGRLADAQHAAELLERDLLPRLVPGPSHLVAAIVGPNNAGKSALFNAIAGRRLSPSLPEGGATQRALGAAHPELLARLQAEPALARFHLRSAGSEPGGLALRAAEDVTELGVVSEGGLPPHLMLIDTPDFDSIVGENRQSSESVLMVADLVIAVVTRHSYQNREVVEFLRDWLQHGRPWLLVYNEAIDATVAARHMDKLIADVGHAPAERFWASYDLAVASDEKPLTPVPLAGKRTSDLRQWLRELPTIEHLKQLAFSAALGRLRMLLGSTVEAIRVEQEEADRILAAARARTDRVSAEIAEAAMPGEAFVEAFRTVLDRRTNAISRSWRGMLRRLRVEIERLPRLLWSLGRSSEAEDPSVRREDLERKALTETWPSFWEELARDLGPEQRCPAVRQAAPQVTAALTADLSGSERREAALADALASLPVTATDLDSFRRACEHLIEQAIEERGFDIDIQAAADLATIAPLALATAVMLTTHGVGVDLAAAGGGAISTFLVDKYSHLLGSDILANVRERWTSLRGAHVSPALLAAALPTAHPLLQARVSSSTILAEGLTATIRRINEMGTRVA